MNSSLISFYHSTRHLPEHSAKFFYVLKRLSLLGEVNSSADYLLLAKCCKGDYIYEDFADKLKELTKTANDFAIIDSGIKNDLVKRLYFESVQDKLIQSVKTLSDYLMLHHEFEIGDNDLPVLANQYKEARSYIWNKFSAILPQMIQDADDFRFAICASFRISGASQISVYNILKDKAAELFKTDESLKDFITHGDTANLQKEIIINIIATKSRFKSLVQSLHYADLRAFLSRIVTEDMVPMIKSNHQHLCQSSTGRWLKNQFCTVDFFATERSLNDIVDHLVKDNDSYTMQALENVLFDKAVNASILINAATLFSGLAKKTDNEAIGASAVAKKTV